MTKERDFALRAQPHSWLLVAENLHAQAIAVYKSRGKSITTRLGPNGEVEGRWDTTNRSAFLLGGFALENCIKAYLVYENPEWISGGKLSKKLRSHSLTKLASMSQKLPPAKHDGRIIAAFEHGLESWARYPCGLTVESTEEEAVLTEVLWIEYVELISLYGNQMQDMLREKWNGPHGIGGHFEFSGSFFTFM